MCKAGVIGCRGIGVQHATGIAGSDKARLAAACDLDQNLLDEFSARFPDEEVVQYQNHREMIEKEQLDIVTVATSDHAHATLVIDAAEGGAKGIFCEKPLATSLADADRMIAACEANGALLSVDHTRRWWPLWRHAKEQIVDQGVIGPVQHVISHLNGPRAMLFRNGTHLLDVICYFAGAQPRWVVGDLEAGYEDYTEYRGDGGHVPETEPGANAYIHFENGVRGFYAGGSKNTHNHRYVAEIVGTSGRIFLGGSDEGILYLQDQDPELIAPPAWPVVGIPAAVGELIDVVADGGQLVSPGRAGLTVVELIIGILESQQQGNAPIALPLSRD